MTCVAHMTTTILLQILTAALLLIAEVCHSASVGSIREPQTNQDSKTRNEERLSNVQQVAQQLSQNRHDPQSVQASVSTDSSVRHGSPLTQGVQQKNQDTPAYQASLRNTNNHQQQGHQPTYSNQESAALRRPLRNPVAPYNHDSSTQASTNGYGSPVRPASGTDQLHSVYVVNPAVVRDTVSSARPSSSSTEKSAHSN